MFVIINNDSGYTMAKGGDQTMSRIKCLVEECRYNSDYLCDAEQIEVCSCGSEKSVRHSDETACRTFTDRG